MAAANMSNRRSAVAPSLVAPSLVDTQLGELLQTDGTLTEQDIQAIFAAQELTGNLLYELAVVRKMDYQIAWELATREWAFLPDEGDQPQLSFDPATLDPSQPLPAISA